MSRGATRGLINTQEIADALKIDYQAAQKRLWRASIQPIKVIDRSNLYEPSVIKKGHVEMSRRNRNLTKRDYEPREPRHRNKIPRAKTGSVHKGIDLKKDSDQVLTSTDDKW